jgi:hypothetical protein
MTAVLIRNFYGLLHCGGAVFEKTPLDKGFFKVSKRIVIALTYGLSEA